jgi:hypothetical protein
MARISNARVLAILDAIDTDANAGAGAAIIRVYASTGTPPLTLDDAVNGTLLGTLTMSDPAFGAAADTTPGGSLTAAAIANDTSADATGTPDYARILDSDLNPIMQVSCGVGGGELNFLTSIVATQPIQISSFVVTLAEGG